MLLALLLVVVLLIAFYFKLKYFTIRGPLPGLSPHFLFGNLIQAGFLLHGISINQAIATFKDRFGDIFQLWLGPTRVIVVSGIGDVQHIFTHRNIYDQGDMLIKQFSILFPDGLISLKG
jgi:hypothetical protein